MAQEVDPAIGKGVKLLLSNDETSSEELRAHLEEQIRLRFGSRRAQGIASLSPNTECVTSASTIIGKRRPETPGSDDSSMPARKIPKIVDSGNKSSSSSPTLNFDSGSSGGDSEDLALEILEENLCFVCKGIQTTSRNRFVECTDCHNLYHQNCASPPIEADVTDPRFVWYCDNCRKGSPASGKVTSCSSTSSSCSTSGSPPTSSSGFLSQKISSPVSANSSGTLGSGNTGSSTQVNSSSKPSSTTSISGVQKPVVGAIRSQNTSYTLVNKPFGNKFRLFKTAKRN